jgi:peroxiredoxin
LGGGGIPLFRNSQALIDTAPVRTEKEDCMPNLRVGDKAPLFELPLDMEVTWKLADKIGTQNIVLLFFPFAYSSVCHDEMCAFRDGFREFKNLDALVVAISVDSPFVLNKWKEELQLPFSLLSDFNKTVAPLYGAFHETIGPLKGAAKRSAFVIDKQGIIRYAWVSDDPKNLPDVTAIKKVLDGLK